MVPKIMVLLVTALHILQLPLSNTQECLSKQQVANTLKQMQKLLSSHEAAQLQNIRSLKKQLMLLQHSSVHKQAAKHNVSCTLPPAPLKGRRLGKKVAVGHEVHFLCNANFQLVGSETRTCLENQMWSGQQPICKRINNCASNPCANGGTCVDGIGHYSCLCPSGWSGSTCRKSLPSYLVTLKNSSFSHQPRCADNSLGSSQCSCDLGFQMQAGFICQDVDECQLFQPSRQTRLCTYECVNVPGSYRCICPEGYQLQASTNTCHDVDECAENQHNCTHEQLCINIFGGFRCVRPECPKARMNTSYVKTSPFHCERSPCPMKSSACRQAANAISFHYLALQSNRTVPRVLFKMSTSRFVGDSLRFAILEGNGLGMLVVQRSNQQTGELVLIKPVVGLATLEVQVEMSEFAQKSPLGKHLFKVTVFVSQYEF